jgi:hypothetical protein
MTRTVAAAMALALAMSAPAAAHQLDEYLQAARVLLERDRLLIEIDLTPGAGVAPGVIAAIDRDRDGAISPAEAKMYGLEVLEDVTVTMDGRRIALSLRRIEIPSPGEMRDGMATIQLEATGAAGAIAPGRHSVDIRNEHRNDSSVYLVNALLSQDGTVTVLSQRRDSRQSQAQIEYDVAGTASPIVWVMVAGLMLAGLAAFRIRPSSHRAIRPSGHRAIRPSGHQAIKSGGVAVVIRSA